MTTKTERYDSKTTLIVDKTKAGKSKFNGLHVDAIRDEIARDTGVFLDMGGIVQQIESFFDAAPKVKTRCNSEIVMNAFI